MKIVVLDGYCLNPGDLAWDGLRRLGDLELQELLRHLGQFGVSFFLLVECLFQQVGRFGIAQLLCHRTRGAIGRHFVVLHPLGSANQRLVHQ